MKKTLFATFLFCTFAYAFMRTRLENHLENRLDPCLLTSFNSRFLKNKSGDINIAHWTYLMMNIYARIPEMDEWCTSLGLRFVDNEKSDNFLRQLTSEVFEHDYVKETLKIFSKATDGIALVRGNVEEDGNGIHFFDSQRAETNVWKKLNRTDFNAVARKALECSNRANVGDVLIYRRAKTRRLLNVREASEFFERLSFQVKALDAEELTPRQQICTLSEKWKAIVSPHGAQQAPLLYKHPDTLFFEATPTLYFEGNRCFVRPNGGWLKIYGEHVWKCDDECSEAPLGRLYARPCSKACRKRAKTHDIKLLPEALRNIATRIA